MPSHLPSCTLFVSQIVNALIVPSVPVVGVMVVLLFLHRRNKRKLAEEDSKDKYKSHDWGMEGVAKAGKKGGPEMSV